MTNVRTSQHTTWGRPYQLLTIACWDTPPPVDSPLYAAFKKALAKFFAARKVRIPVLTPAQCKLRENQAAQQQSPPQSQPDCVVGGVSSPSSAFTRGDCWYGSLTSDTHALPSRRIPMAVVQAFQTRVVYPCGRHGTGKDVCGIWCSSQILTDPSVQIASLLGYLGSDELQIYPFLVVVPNSYV